MLSNGATVAASPWRYSGGVEDAGGLRGGTGACGTATGADDRNVEHAVRLGTPPSSLDDVTLSMVGKQIGPQLRRRSWRWQGRLPCRQRVGGAALTAQR